MPGKNHVHKYEKVLIGSQKLWTCSRGENCTHYLPKYLESRLIGKLSLCWNCGEEFTLDELNTSIARPVCNACNGRMDIVSILENLPGME